MNHSETPDHGRTAPVKTTLITLGSALTLVGGHLLNRRWDRAVFFYLLLFAATWFGAGVALFNPQWGGFSARQLFGGALVLLWLIGLLVTVRDIRRPDDTRQPAWSITGGIAALILTVWSTLLLGWGGAVVLGKLDGPWQNGSEEPAGEATTNYRTFRSDHFSNYIYYGQVDNLTAERPAPPEGDGQLVGRIEYEGRPAVGVVLRLILNGGDYRTAPLTTDESGRFTLNLAPGRWRVEALLTEAWPGQPKEKPILLTGDESHFGEGNGFSWRIWRRKARVVGVSAEDPPSEALVLRFRDPITITWPPGKQQTAGEDATLRWHSYPGAQKYQIVLSTVARRGGSTSYSPSTARAVHATELSLDSFHSVPAPGEQHEYAVQIYAYDREGRPLTRSGRFYSDTFILEGRRLVPDALARSPQGAFRSAKELEQLRTNEKRLDAVRVLIDEELPQAAEALLQKVDGPAKLGRREALTAYLRARQGRCEEARELAATAKANGADCTPERYLAACAE